MDTPGLDDADVAVSRAPDLTPPPPRRLVLVVAAALIRDAGEPGAAVLLAQRPAGKSNQGQWELPGGKVDANESPEDALVRELQEELGVLVHSKDLTPLAFSSHSLPAFHLLMPLYVCHTWQGSPRGMEQQQLAWATADDLPHYVLTDPDVPLLPRVLEALRGRRA